MASRSGACAAAARAALASVAIRVTSRTATRLAARAAVLAVVASVAAPAGGAQVTLTPQRSWIEAEPGSALERYFRLLALDSATRRAPLASARGYGPVELSRLVARDSVHPWASRVPSATARPRGLVLLRPSVSAIVNSGFPFGMNDGPVWAGRGLTTVAEVGVVGTLGPLTVRLAPVLFRAENNAFALFDNGQTDDAKYRDAIDPATVDMPQRFGAEAYQRVDLGNSEIRLDYAGLVVGFGNANETWGPAVTHPLILGTNAPGFLHGFVGTNRPLPIGIGRLHGRVAVGRIEQSDYSPAADSLSKRLMAGLVLAFAPGGIFQGLEIGGTRFFHRRWESGEIPWDAWRIPFEGLLFKEDNFDVDDPNSPNYMPDNQLGSVFARWAFPTSGFEVYGEIARNDASVDLREIIVEPDHATAYMFGAQKLFRRRADRWEVLRGEIVNARASHIDRVRPQARFYQHDTFSQGHTSRGQVLGSVAVMGGSGFVVGADRYTRDGLTTIELHRLGRNGLPNEGTYEPSTLDMQYVLRGERTQFRGGSDLVLGGGLVVEPNRDSGKTAFGLLLSAGYRWGRTPPPQR